MSEHLLKRHFSSFPLEETFVRAALPHCHSQKVHGHVCHSHSVQVGEARGPGRGCARGLMVDDLLRLFPARTALPHLLPPLLCVVFQLVVRRSRHPCQTPVKSLFARARARAERVRQSRVPLLAAGFGCYRGLHLKPLSQLVEAVV